MTDVLLSSTNIPASFSDTLFRDYDVKRRPGAKSILRKIDAWDPTVSKPGLLLQGIPGVGKTMLASALLNEYHEGYGLAGWTADNIPSAALLALLQEKCPVYFIQLAELINLNIRRFRLAADIDKGIRDPQEYLDLDHLLEDLKHRVKVLVIDDVGKEHHTNSGFAQDEFDLLVRTRHNAGFTTIYTTNIPLRRWGDEYSESMQSLIERSSLVLDFP
jgi:DNA replication protein DnaC